MSGTASNLLHLWHIPSTKILFRTSNLLHKGFRYVPDTKIPANLCYCRKLQTETYEIVKGSYVPVTPTIPDSPKDPKEKRIPVVLESVGAFQRLPMVKPSVDILYSALRKAKKISPTKGIVNIAKREKNKGARQLDALMKELGIPLREYMESFPNKICLHPYERSLIELTLGDGNYEAVLGRVSALKKKVVSVGKEHASLCNKSTNKREAEERLSEGMKKLEAIFKQEGKAVDDLLDIAKTLRAVPVVDLETPTLCLVGAPNVGKSSLVRILSTGKPEVCNYPFTTRGILMGHITVNYQRFQVTDTPGLLKRHDDTLVAKGPWKVLLRSMHYYTDISDIKKNNLEKLTLAVLANLPTAVLYVHDLTGECGTSPSDQFLIYKEVRERFSDHLWINVVSKSDLLQNSPVTFVTEDGDADDLEMAKYRKQGPEGSILVSVKSEAGLEELKSRVHEMLISQLTKLQSEKAAEQEKTEVKNSDDKVKFRRGGTVKESGKSI